MTYGELYQRVRRQLNDNTVSPRWPDSALRMYAGTVLRRMAEVAPASMASVEELTLAEGALQAVPGHVVRVLGAVKRSSDGRSIRNVSPEVMDTVLPFWRDAPQSEDTTDCVYDASVPTEFSVFPPAANGTQIWMRVSLRAVDPESGEDEIPANQINEMALFHGVLALCFAEDTDTGDRALSMQHWGQFYEALGVQQVVDAENPPAAKEDRG